MKFMNAVSLCLVTVSALALTGCGRDKANAIREYSDIKLEALHGEQNPDQDLAGFVSFRITTLHSSDGFAIPRFYEGEEGSAKFSVEILDSQITNAELKFIDGTNPKGSRLERSPNEKNVWLMKWTPEPGLSQSNPQVEIKLVARAAGVRNFKAWGTRKNYYQNIAILPSKVGPSVSTDTLPKKIDEGVSTSFTINIKDSAGRGNPPQLETFKYVGTDNTESPKFDALTYMSQPKVSGPNADGTYSYTFSINPSGSRWEEDMKGEMKKADTSGADLCFSVRVVSQTTFNRSNTVSPCMKAMFTAQPPFVSWKNDPDFMKNGVEEITAGNAEAIVFTAKTYNEKGNVLVLNNLKAALKALPSEKDGEAKLDCGDQSVPAFERTCTLSWTPSCKTPLKKAFALNFNIKNELKNGNVTTTKTRSEKRTFTVIKKAESCDAKGSI